MACLPRLIASLTIDPPTPTAPPPENQFLILIKYTQEEIEVMPAGREFDALIQERLYLLTVTRNWPCMPDECGGWLPKVKRRGRTFSRHSFRSFQPTTGRGYNREVIPFYSTDIEAAWCLLAEMRERGWYSHHTDLTLDSGQEWWSWSFLRHAPLGNGLAIAQAETAPLALCRAALIATL